MRDPRCSERFVAGDLASLEAIVKGAIREVMAEFVAHAGAGAPGVSTTSGASTPCASDAQLLSTRQAAQLASVCDKTLRQWVSSGRLPCRRAGRLIRIHRDELERFLSGFSDSFSDSSSDKYSDKFDPRALAASLLKSEGL